MRGAWTFATPPSPPHARAPLPLQWRTGRTSPSFLHGAAQAARAGRPLRPLRVPSTGHPPPARGRPHRWGRVGPGREVRRGRRRQRHGGQALPAGAPAVSFSAPLHGRTDGPRSTPCQSPRDVCDAVLRTRAHSGAGAQQEKRNCDTDAGGGSGTSRWTRELVGPRDPRGSRARHPFPNFFFQRGVRSPDWHVEN